MGSSKKRDIHVVPNTTNDQLNWSVKREGAQRASSVYDNKSDALKAARETAIKQGLELFEHGKNGRIQSRNSFGNDPRKSRG